MTERNHPNIAVLEPKIPTLPRCLAIEGRLQEIIHASNHAVTATGGSGGMSLPCVSNAVHSGAHKLGRRSQTPTQRHAVGLVTMGELAKMYNEEIDSYVKAAALTGYKPI